MTSSVETYTVEELVKEGVIAKPLDGNHGGIHPKASDYVESGIPCQKSGSPQGVLDIE